MQKPLKRLSFHITFPTNIYFIAVGPLRDYAQRKSWIENMLQAGGFFS